MNGNCMLTTFDNPYNPFTQFDSWFLFDMTNGYDSCGLVGRFARTSESFTDKENEKEIERAIDEIIKYDILNIYKKITKNSGETAPVV